MRRLREGPAVDQPALQLEWACADDLAVFGGLSMALAAFGPAASREP